MKYLGSFEKVEFDSLAELKSYMTRDYGDVFYWDGYEGMIYIVRWDDDEENLVLGVDGFDVVDEEMIVNIYAYRGVAGWA